MGSPKLTERKIRYIIRAKRNGQSYKQISTDLKLSISTIKRVWIYWLNTNEIIPLKKGGRKMKDISPEEEKLVLKAYNEQKVGARRLEKIIEYRYGQHIPHNRIHKILLKNNLARQNENKKRRRKKWIRYERKHSLSMVHLDWHTSEILKKEVCVVLDDSSRKILAGGEFDNATEENSINLLKKVIEEYGGIRMLKQVLTDRGTQFYASKRDNEGNAENGFELFLKDQGIKHILARVKHPQTNGKIEKWYDTYEKHRMEYESFEEFVKWYNTVRYHESLDTNHYLQTPEDAFWSRLHEESKLGMFYALCEEGENNEKK